MKKIFTAIPLLAALLLSSCDDGDLIYNDIDFSAKNVVDKCPNPGAEKIFYKIQDQESLILLVDVENLMKDPTLSKVQVTIDGQQTSLEYRKYADKIAADNICKIPSPAFPNVIKSIKASPGGSVDISRNITMKYDSADKDAKVNLTYQYVFYLQNINFNDGQTNIKYDKMFFGTNNYQSRILDFSFTNKDQRPVFANYSCQDQFFALNNKEALSMDLTREDLPSDATSSPLILKIDDQRKLSFKQYQRTGISLNQVCENPGDIPGDSPATINTLVELWKASSGEIHISASWTQPIEGERQLKYQISLVNIVFNKDQYEKYSFVKPIIELGEFY
ncbi:hypothetical protein ACYSNM_10455 [Myroides sp. LJL116]